MKTGQRVIKKHRICYNCCNTKLMLWKTKEEGMKKLGLIIALFLLFSAVSSGAVPNDTEFRKGLKFYNSKNYKAAVKQLQEYVNKKPDPTAYYLIGYSLYKLGKFSEANEYFRQAYLIDPEFSLGKVGLIEKTSREIVPKKPASSEKPAAVSETETAKPEASQPTPVEKKTQPSKPKAEKKKK
jgi:tetratricopeptide (TPR) repeat protein